MKKILLCGAAGRMGREITEYAPCAGFEVAFGVDARADGDFSFPLFPSFSLAEGDADVLIDFSRPEVLPALLAYARSRRLPCVLAATGYADADRRLISAAAESLPVFQSANMSVGIHALKKLAAEAKKLLPGFDVEIIEKHHRAKIDAPSGTALALLGALSGPDTEPVFGREGRSARRAPNEIGVHAVRGGTLAGEHEVDFLGDNETLTITHSAQTRSVFALGALRAAAFVLDKPAGLYGMDDLLG